MRFSNPCAQRSPYGRTRRSYARPLTGFSKKCGPTARSTRSNESTLTHWRSSRPHPRNYSTTQSTIISCHDSSSKEWHLLVVGKARVADRDLVRARQAELTLPWMQDLKGQVDLFGASSCELAFADGAIGSRF